MAALLQTLTDHDYRNWVKGGLGLKIAREGIENFVERNIDQFHQNVMNTLSGPHCYCCSTENIIPCKYKNNFCKFSKNNCTVHDINNLSKKSRKCPNSVCNVIREEIVNQHRFHGPSWSNTDSSRWCREPWQLATCYMSDGYKASNSASETDFPGLLAVIINNKIFDTVVDASLRNKNNVFCKARATRNEILHNADMRLTDTELTRHIAVLDAMLSDTKCLTGHPSAVQARALLTQIRNDTLSISTADADVIRADALRAIAERKQEALEAIDAKEVASKSSLRKMINTFKGIFQLERKEAVTEIQKERKDAVAAVNQANEESKSRVDEAIVAIETKEESAVAAVRKAEDEAKRHFESVSKESRDQIKKALKEELLFVYQDGEHMSTSLGPLATDEDKHIEELYVNPNMKLVDHQIASDNGRPVINYQDIFQCGKKKIYIEGEAGTGKTSLCQNMVSDWCKVNTEHKVNMSNNQQAMTSFDYLFYISLRNVVSDDTIDVMIKHQLLPNKQILQEHLSRVLDEEKCLIILDGLDEWTTKNTTATSAQVNKGLPGRDAVRKCTVLTTTRPWKLECIKLKATQIDTKVKLLGIDKISSEKLIRNMIKHLNDKFQCQKTYEDCITEISDKELNHLMEIPVILKLIVCLWHSGKQLGKNKCAIYSQMFELLLELAMPRLLEDVQYQQKKDEWIKSSIKLPSCFDVKKTKCQSFKPLLLALADLAFHTLLSDDQESSLVFNSTDEGCHNLSPEEVNICLKTGILSQNKILIDCTSQLKQISFLHKTYQEFLAALYVADQLDTKECIKTIKQFCKTNSKFFEMSNVLIFISGLCTSDKTCTLLEVYNKYVSLTYRQRFIIDCMREGWTCSHDNSHLYCQIISIEEPSQYLDQLCKVNIPNIKALSIHSHPTAQCLQYLLQIPTLLTLYIVPEIQSSSISEDLLYDLIHRHRHTLTDISIRRMTLRSNTSLSLILHQVPNMLSLYIWDTTLPQQQLTNLQALHSGRPYSKVNIRNPTILPDAESTD